MVGIGYAFVLQSLRADDPHFNLFITRVVVGKYRSGAIIHARELLTLECTRNGDCVIVHT